MNVDALPVPKLYNAISEHHIRTMCKVFGIALLVQFFLPWGPGMWFPMNFGTVWTLIMGAGLTTLGFLQIPALKTGHLVAIAGGTAFIGLISAIVGLAGGGGLAIFPLLGFFGLVGVTVTIFGLFLWARQGHSQLAYWLVIGGLGSVALSLLIPVNGQMPLIFMFKVFGVSQMNIILRIFFFLMTAAYIGMGVLTLLFVVLKGANAEDGWVKLMGVGWFVFIPASLMLLGFFGMFTTGAMLLMMFHASIMLVTYVFLSIAAGIIILDAAQSNRLKGMFGVS